MYIYKFEGYSSYTSHKNLTQEEEKAINQQQKELPYFIVLPSGEKIDWQDEYRLSEKRTKAGYSEISKGVKVKYEAQASVNYYDYNGCGDCYKFLVVRSEVPLGFEYYEYS